MTDYSALKRLAEAAISSGAELSDLQIDTRRAYTAEFSLIRLYEAATPALVLSLIAENEALRKNAERYRWTSTEGNWVARMFGKWRAHTGEYGDAQPTDWYPSREEAIDAALSKEPQP